MSPKEPAVDIVTDAAVTQNRSARTRTTVIGLVLLVVVFYGGFILMMARH